jgi:hypothetical protein
MSVFTRMMFVFGAVLVLTGCAVPPKKELAELEDYSLGLAYSGPVQPQEKTAILFHRGPLRLTGVDGKGLGCSIWASSCDFRSALIGSSFKSMSYIQVLPGQHELTFYYGDGRWTGSPSAPATLKAGDIVEIKSYLKKGDLLAVYIVPVLTRITDGYETSAVKKHVNQLLLKIKQEKPK